MPTQSGKKKKKQRVAHLVYSTREAIDQYGVWKKSEEILTRYTNPVIDGRFTGFGWYSWPQVVDESVQELADTHQEVIWDDNDARYVYPSERNRKGGENRTAVVER